MHINELSRHTKDILIKNGWYEGRKYDITFWKLELEEELLFEANKWELAHGGLSGRTAQQFIDYLLGKMTAHP